MRLNDVVVQVWQAPIGWIAEQCVYCGEMIWPDSIEPLKHAELHAEKGDIQRLEDDSEGPRFRVVMGRAPLTLEQLEAKRPAGSVI